MDSFPIINHKHKKQHPYLIDIPEGYQYCPECELITPHTLDSQINPSKSMPEDWTCDICDHKKSDFGYCCPMCGWEHDPDRDIAPVTIKVKKHTTVCWEKQRKQDDTANKFKMHHYKRVDENCDCPEVDCYPVQHIFNYRSTPMHWNMECPNAQEWSYDVMCQICNYVFEIEDGNC